MANQQPKRRTADAATVRARVLADEATFGIVNGQIFEAEKSVIDGLVASGNVDPHPDAVAYAESIGAQVVTQPTADAAEIPSA